MTSTLQPAARRMDVVVQAGDDRPIVVPVHGPDGQPRDITGWTARAVVRARPGSPDVLHEWSTTARNAECGPDGVTLLVDDSASWTWSGGHWDLQVTDPAGARRIEAIGTISVRRLVSR